MQGGGSGEREETGHGECGCGAGGGGRRMVRCTSSCKLRALIGDVGSRPGERIEREWWAGCASGEVCTVLTPRECTSCFARESTRDL